MPTTRRTFLGALAATPVALAAATDTATAVPGTAAGAPSHHRHHRRLTNVAHLRFLLDDVPLAESSTHTTYRIGSEPTARAPWT